MKLLYWQLGGFSYLRQQTTVDMKIGIIREQKTPPDARVPLTPVQVQTINAAGHHEVVVQPSPDRCYTDAEYRAVGITLQEDLSDCDCLLGVKEVPISALIPGKRYFFFSHTIKAQPYNRKLLQAILERRIELLDYEVLTRSDGSRVIAFGRWAGIVGAHNGLMTAGRRWQQFDLPQIKHFADFEAAKSHYKTIAFPPMKVVLTGRGRVANGAAEVLEAAGFERWSPAQFRSETAQGPVFTQLDCADYAERIGDGGFDLQEFFEAPERYRSRFAPYTRVADVMINGIYWDTAAPAFFTLEDMQAVDFRIRVIADVTCDIAPESSIPSTLYATTIADPVFGFDMRTGEASAPYQPHTVDMMTIDNLPNELPRDASAHFGAQFMAEVLPELDRPQSDLLARGRITLDGALTPRFAYLADYVAGTA